MKIKKKNNFSSEIATKKKKSRYLELSLVLILILIVVLFAIPYLNLIVMPLILIIGALLLLYILWRQGQPR